MRSRLCIKKSLTKVTSWTFFIGCSIGLLIQGYSCVQQYLSKPQGIDISILPQTEVEIPAFTFCPLDSFDLNNDPPAYNWHWWKKCKLDFTGAMWHGHFGGYSNKSECQDLEKLWENLAVKRSQFGINRVLIYFNDDNKIEFDQDNEKLTWSETVTLYGSCYTLVLPKFNNTIATVRLYIEEKKKMALILHTDGLLFPKKVLNTHSYGIVDIDTSVKEEVLYSAEYISQEVLDFIGKPCQAGGHDYSTCVDESIRNVNFLGTQLLNIS